MVKGPLRRQSGPAPGPDPTECHPSPSSGGCGRIGTIEVVESATPMRARDDQAAVVVWGGGSGGVAAALQAARGGADTLLLTPGPWLGAW